MSSKQWLILMVSLLVLLFMLIMMDFVIAVALSIIVMLFEASVAGIVFKWVFVGLLLLELPVLITYLYKTIKDERNEK